MLCTGAVQLTRSLSGNRRALVQLGTSGKLVGEEGGQEGAVRLLTCTALTGGRAVQVSRQGTARLLEDKPLLWSYLLNSAVRRSKSLANQLCLMIDGSVEMRLARLVLRLADELGLPDARGPFVPYNLSRRDLAAMVCCREETIIRILGRWRRAGVLSVQREGMIILKPEHLHEILAAS